MMTVVVTWSLKTHIEAAVNKAPDRGFLHILGHELHLLRVEDHSENTEKPQNGAMKDNQKNQPLDDFSEILNQVMKQEAIESGIILR